MIRSDLGQMFMDIESGTRNKFAEEIFQAISKLTPDKLEIPAKLLTEIYDTKKAAIKLERASYNLLKDPQGPDKDEQEHINKKLITSVATNAYEESNYYYWPWPTAMN